MSKLKEIRAKCLECMEGPAEVRACTHFNCPLWAFRMGTNPFISEQQREALARRLGKSVIPRPGAGVDLEMLRGWAGWALPMGSIQPPNPRDMTPGELIALGSAIATPAKALKAHDWERDSSHRHRTARRKAAASQKPPHREQDFANRAPGGCLDTPEAHPLENAPSCAVIFGASVPKERREVEGRLKRRERRAAWRESSVKDWSERPIT